MKIARIVIFVAIAAGFGYEAMRAAGSASGQTGNIDSLLVVLDKTINDKAVWVQKRQNKIDSLKREFVKEPDTERKIKISESIFNLYFDFQNDLAMEQADIMRNLAQEYFETGPSWLWMADLNMSRLLRFTGQLKESTDLLNEISHHTQTPDVHYPYLMERMVNYGFLRDNSPMPEFKRYYDMMSEAYRDSVLMFPDRKSSVIIKVERMLRENDPLPALEILYEEYDTLNPLSQRAGTLAYNIALCYEAQGRTDEFIRYLTLSAIADLRSSVRGYKSLQRLAIAMYDSGQIDKAYNYMKCSIEDAILSGARIRSQEAAEMFVVIDHSYQQKVVRQKQIVTNLLIITAIAGMLLLVSLYIVSYLNKRLFKAKLKLSEANRIKEGYLGVFIEEHSNYLSRMNAYRVKSTKILNNGDLAQIGSFVDEALNTTDDHREFYRKFDTTILNIFPTFTDEFNALMTDIPAQKGGSTELTAEQRIAAFIRLGIKETEKIALFLRYSMRTVYNYRSQMRTKAKNPKTLEKDIARIGINK